ncbi:hypothetical protein [Vibrio europaeus]|uniref:hypothetical protein n=1 Tax=Vibrio europaeus TaxID=300876 RepID=UPI00233F52A9|nr:hypothetical protein [Vibrio europaeus]MDC5753598.1 hypothetical protein [Vibrio europaeus]MDC5816489.1 hypothetical protein [Vibrio europaeus]
MKIKQSTAIKLKLTDLDNLDPITVFVEDLSQGEGKITIECYGKSWSSYWGAMGGRTLSAFFVSCNDEYLVNNLAPQMTKYEPDYDTFRQEMRLKVCEMRKDDIISKDLARELYDVEEWDDYVTDNPYEPIKNPCSICEREFDELDFDGFDVPEKMTTSYQYLMLIVGTVKEAFKSMPNATQGEIAA